MRKPKNPDQSDLVPRGTPRSGWDGMFKEAMSRENYEDDELARAQEQGWLCMPNRFDQDEWVWE